MKGASEKTPVNRGCSNYCNAPFGIRCSVCNTDNRAEPGRSEMRPVGYEAVFGVSEVWRHEVSPLLRWLYQATPLDQALVALAPGSVDW